MVLEILSRYKHTPKLLPRWSVIHRLSYFYLHKYLRPHDKYYASCGNKALIIKYKFCFTMLCIITLLFQHNLKYYIKKGSKWYTYLKFCKIKWHNFVKKSYEINVLFYIVKLCFSIVRNIFLWRIFSR